MEDFLKHIKGIFWYDPDTLIVYMINRTLIEHNWTITAAVPRIGKNGKPMLYDESAKTMVENGG